MVDKGTGAARTSTIHPLIQTAAEKDNLGILPAQLYNHIRIWRIVPHRFRGGKDLLHKGKICCFGQPQASRAGNRQVDHTAA